MALNKWETSNLHPNSINFLHGDKTVKMKTTNLDKPKIICYCGSLRVAKEAFQKAEHESVMKGEIALLPCCMFIDIQREYGNGEYKKAADELHKRKIDLCDEVVILNVKGYIGESTKSEWEYAIKQGKKISFLEYDVIPRIR